MPFATEMPRETKRRLFQKVDPLSTSVPIERLVAERICGPPGSVSRSGPAPFNQHAAIDCGKAECLPGPPQRDAGAAEPGRIASATSARFQTPRG